MKSQTKLGLYVLLAIGFTLAPSMVSGHERFIYHELLIPLNEAYFRRLDPNMVMIALRVAALLAVMLFAWFLRELFDGLIENQFVRKLPGMAKEWLHQIILFFTDQPIHHPWFSKTGEWVTGFFLRSPALVLMYSATTESLLIPSYPLKAPTALFFKFMQVVIALGIVTQLFLPLWGAVILGTFVYLIYAYDWKIIIDLVPYLSLVAVYLSLSWNSHSQTLTQLSPRQTRWVRIILGLGFFSLGWMKIYNHDLTAGVADNYPWIMEDPMIWLFYAGTDPTFQRESWVIGFALAEVLAGFAILTGVFCRLWCFLLIVIMSKLMVVDFGWAEIPHLFLIACFMVLMISNYTPWPIWAREAERYKPYYSGAGSNILIPGAAAIAVSALVIFPPLYLLTLAGRP